MMAVVRDYLSMLANRFGQGWNRFWFTPTDPLVLSAIRIGTGFVAACVLLSYTFDLEQFFGADGLLPVTTVEALAKAQQEQIDPDAGRVWRFSYLDYIPSELMTGHIAGLAVLALFTLGCWTRVTSILSLLVVLSYVHRGPVLTSHVEPILAFVLFYLCLGPSGAYLSIDRRRAARRQRKLPALERQEGLTISRPSTAATVSIRLMQVHLSVVYASMALGKLFSPAWYGGDAVWWLIAKPELRLVDLTWLHAFPLYLINAWTHAIVAFELSFAILIWNRLARPLLLTMAVVMWALLAPLVGTLTFPLMMLVANLAFVAAPSLRAMLTGCGVVPDRRQELASESR